MMLRVDECSNEDPGPLPGPICLSALAESSSGRCGTFVCYCWMMLRVDECLNEDPGPRSCCIMTVHLPDEKRKLDVLNMVIIKLT